MVSELVDEDIGREGVVGGHRRVEVEDAASAVLPSVDDDLHHVVGGGRRHLAQALVVEVQHVAFRAESVVGRAQRRAPVDAVRGPRDPALLGRSVERPHVEVGLALLEGRDREEQVGQPPGVVVPLPHLGRGVAVAEEQEVHLLAWRAILHDRPRSPRGRARAIDRRIPGVDRHRPRLVEEPVVAALLQDDLRGTRRLREAERLVEGAERPLGLIGRLPLAADAREAARVEGAVGGSVDHLEEVLAQVGVVDRTGRGCRPTGPRARDRPWRSALLSRSRYGSSRAGASAAFRRRRKRPRAASRWRETRAWRHLDAG